MKEKADNDGKIFVGVDATGKTIWTTEEEQERDACNRQKWQRAKFAKELGFSPDTTDKTELAAIDEKYEEMMEEINEWNGEQQKIADTRALAHLKLMNDQITQEEYENILYPHKGERIRCPTEWGGHGHNFNLFFCTKCKKEFCLFDEKGEQKGSYIESFKDDKIIGTRTLCWFCTEYEEEHRKFKDKIDKK